MAEIICFSFNPFQENTYIVFDETRECVIIDPGCFENFEKKALRDEIEKRNLKPVRLLNTHCHIDHVLGNKFVADTWKLNLEIHREDLPTLHALPNYAHIFGVGNLEESPEPGSFLEEGDKVQFGNTTLDVIFVPGHAPGHIAFVNHPDKTVISGDVLFAGSIGRTDLPGGSLPVLLASIKNKLLPLGDDFTVYSGHGPSTTIKKEKRENYFLQAEFEGRFN